MTCIIVDDEPLAREEMDSLIREVSELEILGEFSNAKSAMAFLQTNQVDVVFLDIQMPKVTGLEFAEKIPKETLIIFTTAFSKYALKSYELDALDYLMKPIEKSRLAQAINKAIAYKELLSASTVKNEVEGSNEDFLLIKSERRFYKVGFKEIMFIEGLKDYVVIHTKNQKLITAMNLKTIHQRISCSTFIRVSKSYVVNMDYVDSFDNHTIYVGELQIPMGEIYRNDFFNRYSGGLFTEK